MKTRTTLFVWLIAVLHCAGATTPAAKTKEGIASLETIRLGGIDQAVLIRGTDSRRPVLLVLHGFAVPMMPFAHLMYGDEGGKLEQNFVVVHYDQRGAGKTARLSEADPGTYNVEQYVKDAEELTIILRERFHREKIFVLGISWGSIIGMKLIQKHPDWFYAYIAEGQASNMTAVYGDASRFIQAEAAAEKNQSPLDDLQSAGLPDPARKDSDNLKSVKIIGKWLEHYYNKKYNLPDLSSFFISSVRGAPEYSFMDFLATLRSIDTFTERNLPGLLRVDLAKEVPDVKVPVYWITGEYDLMKIQGRRYFDTLSAPRKKWIEIPRAGHEVSAHQPDAVDRVYLDILREMDVSRP